MASKQEQIVLKIVDRLTNGLPTATPAITPPVGLLAPHRSPMRTLDEDDLPTYVVTVSENTEDDRDPGSYFAEKVWRRCAWVWVEFRGVAPSGDADGAVDKYTDQWVDYALSVLLTDQQLDGLCDMIEPDRVQYDGFDGKRAYITAAMLFRVYYIAAPI